MVSRNNQWYKLQQGMEQVPHFGIRKLTVGVSSVLLGLLFMGINMTTVHADTATPATNSASQVAAQGTTTTANTGEKANPETAQSTDENAKQHLSDTLKLAQEAGVNVTKSGTKVINGTNANDAENQAALDYQGQNEQVKKAFDEQQKANTQSQDGYNKALEAYKQALKDKGYPVKDGALTGNDIQQNLIFGDEPNVVVNGTVTDNRLMIETGNDINYKHPTFPSQGNYHEIVFKDGNSTAVERELGEFTFTNLQNSYYEGRKISKVVVSFSNLERDGLTDSHFGKHCVVIYDNLTKGLEFAGTSIDVTYRFYDENGQLITLNLKDSYIVPASLNNHGNDKESQTGVNIESVELLSDGKAEQLLGSSVAVDGNNEYSNHFNDGDWDQSVTDDPHGKRTYGSGLFNVSGNHVTLRFYTQVSPDVAASLNKLTPDEWNNGSMWAIVQTVIPTYDDPVPPVKKNSNAKVAYHDVELHVNGSQHVTVNMPNGKTTTTPADQSYQFTKSANGWGSEHRFEDFTLTIIPGYHVDSVIVNGKRADDQVKNNILAGQSVTADNPNADIVVNYAADNQATNIVYEDKDGNIIKKDMVNGKTDETVNTDSSVPDGWKLIPGQTIPSKVTFTGDKTPDTIISVEHVTVHVDHDQPKQPGALIPGTKDKHFPSGVKQNDLNSTVTRTVRVTEPYKGTSTIKQTVAFTRDVTVDAVTGEVKYQPWSEDGNHTFSKVDIPVVPGYTPSQSGVDSLTVKPGDSDSTITITYTPNNYAGKVSYIDDQGHEQSATALAGHMDQTIDIDTDNVPAGWVKEDGQNLPKKMTITDQGIATVYVHIKHGKVVVNPDQPKTPQDKLPDNPSQGYPTGVDSDSLNKTITRTIEVLDPHTGKTTTTQTVYLTRQATVDEVTGQVTYGDWTTGEWDEFVVPAVAGYTPSESKVASQAVTGQTNDTTVTITYTANDQQTNIIYRDKDGNTIKTDTVNGKTDQTVKTNSTVPAGWEVVTGEKPAPSEIKFIGDHTPDTIITVQHKHDIVKPGDDQPTGPLPGDKDRDYPQLEELAKNVHFTVRITDPRTGEVTTKAQEVDYVRQADIDEVTGDVTYSDWKPAAAEASADADAPQSQSFADVVVPTIQGYTAHSHRSHAASDELRLFKAQTGDESVDTDLAVDPDGSVKVKGDSNVTAGTPDRLVEVTYTANPQSGKIIYVDPNGNPIAETPIQGVTDQTIPFTPQIPAGYELVPGQTILTEITFNGDGQPVVVKVEIEKIPTLNNRGGNGQANGGYYNGTRLENDGSQANDNAAGQHQANDQQLPQTGDENSSALVGLGLMGITLGMFGLKKKEDN